MSRRRIVVIGGVAAGMSAASRARRVDPGAEIAVYEAGRHVSYGACGLPYLLSGVVPSPDHLVAYTADFFRHERNIKVVLGRKVAEVDPASATIRLEPDSAGRAERVGFDRLVIATGARAVVPALPGVELEGVFTLRTLEDALRIRNFLQSARPRAAAVVGGGYIGLEAAEALGRLGLKVTVLERLPRLMITLEPELSERVRQEMEANGVRVVTGVQVEALLGPGRVTHVLAGERVPADIVILAAGVRPNSEIAAAAGLALGPSGAIRTDDRQETSVPGIYAAGDVAEAIHRVTGAPAWIPLGTTANKQGRVAGENAAGGQARFPGVLGTAGVRLFELEVARTGLNLDEARAAGLRARAVWLRHRSRAHYFPGGGPVLACAVVEEGTGRLLGAQMAGSEGIAKRVDVCAAAIQAGWTVEELAALDASYSPPFAPVWDPVLLLARAALR